MQKKCKSRVTDGPASEQDVQVLQCLVCLITSRRSLAVLNKDETVNSSNLDIVNNFYLPKSTINLGQ